MDEIDMKLLQLLQKNSRSPIKYLAKEVSLSSPAVSARIERLEKRGVIRGYTLDLDPLQLGQHILAYINLDMQPAQKTEFYPFIGSCANVLECNCVTGNYSMLIKVSFPSTQDLDSFIGQLQKFGKTETQIVFSAPVPPRGLVL
ncbi:Lrp/AsnC family transcriptional regulator [Butyricicoccus sp. Marseille-Q5471]|uniref:Lrp/AsnC family transcriptional regulator n=1 Tax=Butyricicoccus sp. Marseille-Q5471 TaxID=3039493 RepID=UPI0024BC3089|nr:Lrp/AsnC family transcriptional regulator [Butyricicoccus sp. Marseille-Q5471]